MEYINDITIYNYYITPFLYVAGRVTFQKNFGLIISLYGIKLLYFNGLLDPYI